MGKEPDAEVSAHKSDREDKTERKHKHHHHHHKSKSYDKSSKEDSVHSLKGDPESPRKHHHRKSTTSTHHHHHSTSKEGKDDEKIKKHHHRSYNEGSNEPKESSVTKPKEHHHHSRQSSQPSSPVVGSRLTPYTSDSIRSSRRNSRIDGIGETPLKSTEDPKLYVDANGSMEDLPKGSANLVVEERTVIEHVAVTNTPTTSAIGVEQVTLIVPTEPAVTEEPRPAPPVLTVIVPPAQVQAASTPDYTPDTGNPGKIPSPMRDFGLRENKRFSSIIEPPLPWESKKDKRKARRVVKKSEHKKNILGETIYKGHPSWLLMRDIQTGLFQSIKIVFSNAGKDAINLFHTPPVQVFPIEPGSTSTFKFKDYCPGAFYKLREHFGINHQEYVASICHNWNEVGTPGKSGSLFFFSQDNQYVLKTIPKREAKLLRALLPSYYHHMVKHDNSLLTRFLGLHRVKPHKGRQVRFLVMGNLFRGPLKIHQRFDLKGSTVGRELSAVQRQKANPTFKDMDFRRLNKKIPLGPTVREPFLQQLAEDCQFLVSQNIMDYSLLIGIHFSALEGDADSDDSSNDENDPSPMSRSGSTLPQFIQQEDNSVATTGPFESIFEKEEGGVRGRAEDGTVLDEYYYIGIIDILMLYTMRKQIEHVYKSAVSRGGEISSVKPEEYAARFIKFISDITS